MSTQNKDRQIKNYDRGLYPFKSNWVRIDNNEVHYIDEGGGDTILFCHPPIASSFMYRNMIKGLSKNFRCIALDFPGFGLSRCSLDYVQSVESQASIVEHLLRYLNIDSVYLVMQEVGGHAAISVFMKHPRWLKGIILTDTIIFPVSQYPKLLKMLNIVNSKAFNLINSNFNLLIKILTTSGVKRRKMISEERLTYKAMFNTRKIRRASTILLHQLVEKEELLSRIEHAFETTFNNKPALLIYGESDSLTKLEVPQRIHALMEDSELHFIEGEGHFPHEGAPDEMNKIISAWLKKLALRNSTQLQNQIK